MNYQTVSSTKDGRDDLIFALGVVGLLLFVLQFLLWLMMYDSGTELISWPGVGLVGLAGSWLTVIFLYRVFKRGQGTQTTADFGHGFVALKHGDHWGFFAAGQERIVLPFEFTSIRVASRDRYGKPEYLELEKAGLVGLYSLLAWRHVIPIQYKQIVIHHDDLCPIQGPDDRWGVFSLKRDRLVMPVEYHGYKVWPRCHDFVGVPDGKSEERKWGIFSIADQEVVTSYEYDDISYLNGEVFTLQKGRRKRRSENHHLRFGLYLGVPRVVIEPRYHSINEFGPGFGLLELQEGSLHGLISTTTGQFVVAIEYWSMRRLSDNEFELNSRGGKRIVDLANPKTV